MVEGQKRFHMDTDRRGVTHRFVVGGMKCYLTINETIQGGKPVPGELFLHMAKTGATLSGFTNAVALLVSMCLQYGVPLEVLCRKFVGWRFEPWGWVENAEQIPYASSILDYVFRYLAIRYLGQPWLDLYDLEQGYAEQKGLKA